MENLHIPKIVHLCWFSKDPYPVEIKACIESWRKIIPDYTIRVWNLQEALALHYDYVNEALALQKWAFAADVVRVYALYTEGGVYMDSDVFLKHRFDKFITNKFVSFYECSPYEFKKETAKCNCNEVPIGLQAACMIGEKGNLACKCILDYYKTIHFINPDLSLNMRVSPFIYANVLEKHGMKYINDEQTLPIGVSLYQSKYLAARNRYENPECFGIHRISHSWKDFGDYPILRQVEKRICHYYKVCKYNLLKTC
jgi:hypothetical protein